MIEGKSHPRSDIFSHPLIWTGVLSPCGCSRFDGMEIDKVEQTVMQLVESLTGVSERANLI